MLLKPTLSAAFVALIALSGTAQAESHASADTVVATVNGTEITLGHMIVLKQRLPQQYQSLAPDVLFDGIMDQLVQQTLLGDLSGELSPGSIATLENEERALRAAEAIRGIVREAMTDEALQAEYETSYGEVLPESEFNASHILVDTEEEAIAIIEELTGGADFAELAAEKSTGPSGPNGGQLGWFGKGAMVPPFEEAVLAMEAGTISEVPVQTQFGWHVIRLNETREVPPPSLEEVRPQLFDQIRRRAVESRAAELEAASDVTRMTKEDIDPALLDDLSLLGE
ncbi:MAG: peptidylprolyl isomerase [Boseongicola sp.]|nr:peptidylprolyl isomerase [Boseongicola sp.]MDD9976939.1 peptidylprolyl isomerase [Boseongicola sp.]